MSKIVLVCLRTPTPSRIEATRHHLRRFLESLRPDNLLAAPTEIADDGHGLFLGIFNLVADALHECSAYTGWLMSGRDRWWKPRTEVPDGSFALFRSDDERIEVLADYTASRTVWIAKSETVFIASTSQRAIPWFLGSFEPNQSAIAWMLSSGSLGPGQSWDRRAHPLGPGGSACLDRARWELAVDEPPVTFRVDPAADELHASRVRSALRETFVALDLDRSKWLLPLSGGHDSRAILLHMQDRQTVKCITWGLRTALTTPGTDAFVARKVADFLGLSHQYFETDLTNEPADRILERFLVAGEGRVDNIFGYLDGFRLWSSLAARGVVGTIRGDHGFGHRVVSNADEARLRVGMTLWSDYRNVPALAELDLPHLAEQRPPTALEQQPGESAPDWRDRLFHASRITTVYAALNELKSSYGEIANPLLVRRLVELARTHPEHLRTGKKLFRDVAAEVGIPVDYADAHGTASPDDALGHPSVRELLLDELSSARTRDILSTRFAAFVTGRFRQRSNPRRGSPPYAVLKRSLKRILPRDLTAALKRGPDWHAFPAKQIALRAFLVSRMFERLRSDAKSGHSIG
jgi:hypothetical protein